MRSTFIDQSAQPLKNLDTNPSADINFTNWFTYGSGISRFGDTTKIVAGVRSMLVTKTGATGSAGQYRTYQVEAGKWYIASFHAWCETNAIRSHYYFSDDLGAQIGSAVTITPDLPPAVGWQRFMYPTAVQAPPGAVSMRVHYYAVSMVDGGSINFDAAQFEESVPGGKCSPYADGSFPGWKWTGAANASASVGWPYTLESIAGKPTYFAENVASSSTPVASLGNGTDFTIASVQSFSAVASTPAFWDVSAGSNRRRRILALDTLNARTDSALVAGGLYTKGYPLDVLSRHAMVCRLHSAGVDVTIDGVISTPQAQPGLEPLDSGGALSLRVGARDGTTVAANLTSRVVAAWTTRLDDETTKRVSGWLARRYGTSIPAGY